MIPDIVFQRIASHYFYQYLSEDTYIELESLLIPHYIDEEYEPSEDEMVEMSITFLNEVFYK